MGASRKSSAGVAQEAADAPDMGMSCVALLMPIFTAHRGPLIASLANEWAISPSPTYGVISNTSP